MKKTSKIFIFLFLISIIFSQTIQAKNVIEFWTINLSPQYDSYFNNKIIEYERDNPGIKINWEDINFSSINQQLRFRIAEGEAPDLVNLSPQLMAPLLKDDLLFPISDLEKNYGQKYYPNLWDNGLYNNKIYAFPWYLSSRLMAYNQEMFKIAGLDPLNPPQTKEELFEAAVKIKETTGVYALMPQIRIHQEFIEAGIDLFKEENGQLRAAFHTEEALEIIENYQRLAAESVIAPDSLNRGFNIALERYLENELAILFTAPQFLAEIENDSDYLKDMTALAVIPAAGEGLINAGLMNLVIPQNSENKEIAADFAAFITSANSQKKFSELAAVLPSAIIDTLEVERKEVITERKSDSSLADEAQIILREQLSKNKDLTLQHPQASELLSIMNEQFARAFSSKISAAEALRLMENGWNRVLSENEGE